MDLDTPITLGGALIVLAIIALIFVILYFIPRRP
jgi:hypothetical protein